jgi:hypothetical protein
MLHLIQNRAHLTVVSTSALVESSASKLNKLNECNILRKPLRRGVTLLVKISEIHVGLEV